MGLFDGLFGKSSANLSQEIDRYRELIRFIAFAKKIKPLTGGNYGIHITYDVPKQNEYTSRVYATFGFYDFNEITFAREYATGVRSPHVDMVQCYYNTINEKAGLERQDWPYGIDASDFAEVLRGTYCQSFFTLIPDDRDEDIATFKVVGGIESRNATQVSKAVINVLESQFPELQISNKFSTPYYMSIVIRV